MAGMPSGETELVRRLRNANLPRSLRGFREDATRQLLEQAANVLERACRDRDRAFEDAKAAVGARGDDSPQTEAVGRALVTATSVSDQIVASAREKAEHLVAESEQDAARRIAEARQAADELLHEAE